VGSRRVYRGIRLKPGLLPFFSFCSLVSILSAADFQYIEYALILLLLLLITFLVRHIMRRERGRAIAVLA
jgi:hypothetical protein